MSDHLQLRHPSKASLGETYENFILWHVVLNLRQNQNLISQSVIGGRFDDLILRVDKKKYGKTISEFYLRQIKHRAFNERTGESKTINEHDLCRGDGSFSLKRYLVSFCNIIENYSDPNIQADSMQILNNKTLKEVSLFTNSSFDCNLNSILIEVNSLDTPWGKMEPYTEGKRMKIDLNKLSSWHPWFIQDLKSTLSAKIKHIPQLSSYNEKEILEAFFTLLTFEINQPNVKQMENVFRRSLETNWPLIRLFNTDAHFAVILRYTESFRFLQTHKSGTIWSASSWISSDRKFEYLRKLLQHLKIEFPNGLVSYENNLLNISREVSFVEELKPCIKNEKSEKILQFLVGQRRTNSFPLSTALALYSQFTRAELLGESLFLRPTTSDLQAILNSLNGLQSNYNQRRLRSYLIIDLPLVESALEDKIRSLLHTTSLKLTKILKIILITDFKRDLKLKDSDAITFQGFPLCWQNISEATKKNLFIYELQLENKKTTLGHLGFDFNLVGLWINSKSIEELLIAMTRTRKAAINLYLSQETIKEEVYIPRRMKSLQLEPIMEKVFFNSTSSALIQGMPGSGKSLFLSRLKNQNRSSILQSDSQFVNKLVLYLDLNNPKFCESGIKSVYDAAIFFMSHIKRYNIVQEGSPEVEPQSNVIVLENLSLTILRALLAEKPYSTTNITFILDEFDSLLTVQKETIVNIINLLIQTNSKHIQMLITSRFCECDEHLNLLKQKIPTYSIELFDLKEIKNSFLLIGKRKLSESNGQQSSTVLEKFTRIIIRDLTRKSPMNIDFISIPVHTDILGEYIYEKARKNFPNCLSVTSGFIDDFDIIEVYQRIIQRKLINLKNDQRNLLSWLCAYSTIGQLDQTGPFFPSSWSLKTPYEDAAFNKALKLANSLGLLKAYYGKKTTHSTLVFIHPSIPEYLFASYVLTRLGKDHECNQNIFDILLRILLSDKEFANLRWFLRSLLQPILPSEEEVETFLNGTPGNQLEGCYIIRNSALNAYLFKKWGHLKHRIEMLLQPIKKWLEICIKVHNCSDKSTNFSSCVAS